MHKYISKTLGDIQFTNTIQSTNHVSKTGDRKKCNPFSNEIILGGIKSFNKLIKADVTYFVKHMVSSVISFRTSNVFSFPYSVKRDVSSNV